jgi:carbamoyltransferase
MIVLGISGCEDTGQPVFTAPWGVRGDNAAVLLGFAPGRVPLQCLPLRLLGHDGAAALVRDGELVAFAAEERLSRVKHGFNLAGRTTLPHLAARWCLAEAGLSFADVDVIAHYCRFDTAAVERRLARLSAQLAPAERTELAQEHAEAFASRLSPEAVNHQLSALAGRDPADGDLPQDSVIRVPHHVAHVAGAFHSAGCAEAAVIAVDGYGEEDSMLWGAAGPDGLTVDGTLPLPGSLGLLYQVVTVHLGFRSFGDEYKVMGLSAYGRPRAYAPFFRRLVELRPDGGLAVANLARADLLPWLRDELGTVDPPGAYSRKAADIAAALQASLEEALLHVAAGLRERHGLPALCLSGGVALNARANGVLLRSGLFREVFIQPAAGDDGAALGAAFQACRELDGSRRPAPVRHVFWGPDYDDAAIESALRAAGVRWRRVPDIASAVAALLAQGKIVGWFQGRTEMGPRALGARSILADPRSTALRDKLNARVKGREPFRPFAPAVIRERAAAIFDLSADLELPFMLVTMPVLAAWRKQIAAVVHVDGSARVQTVTRNGNARYHDVIHAFGELTGVPVLLNTSFNRAGEPIVNSPQDALACFHAAGLDALAIGDCLVLAPDAEGSS